MVEGTGSPISFLDEGKDRMKAASMGCYIQQLLEKREQRKKWQRAMGDEGGDSEERVVYLAGEEKQAEKLGDSQICWHFALSPK